MQTETALQNRLRRRSPPRPKSLKKLQAIRKEIEDYKGRLPPVYNRPLPKKLSYKKLIEHRKSIGLLIALRTKVYVNLQKYGDVIFMGTQAEIAKKFGYNLRSYQKLLSDLIDMGYCEQKYGMLKLGEVIKKERNFRDKDTGRWVVRDPINVVKWMGN